MCSFRIGLEVELSCGTIVAHSRTGTSHNYYSLNELWEGLINADCEGKISQRTDHAKFNFVRVGSHELDDRFCC